MASLKKARRMGIEAAMMAVAISATVQIAMSLP